MIRYVVQRRTITQHRSVTIPGFGHNQRTDARQVQYTARRRVIILICIRLYSNNRDFVTRRSFNSFSTSVENMYLNKVYL